MRRRVCRSDHRQQPKPARDERQGNGRLLRRGRANLPLNIEATRPRFMAITPPYVPILTKQINQQKEGSGITGKHYDHQERSRPAGS